MLLRPKGSLISFFSFLIESYHFVGVNEMMKNGHFVTLLRREALRPIKNIALYFWKEQMKGCGPEDYVFSSTFKPGKYKLQPKHISNKWKLYVKEELNIDVDLYALKHLNLDETSSILNAEEAARM